MKVDENILKVLGSKTKVELIEEILKLKNGNGKSNPINRIDINKSKELSKLIVENSHLGIFIINMPLC